jgi:hypothetical protein
VPVQPWLKNKDTGAVNGKTLEEVCNDIRDCQTCAESPNCDWDPTYSEGCGPRTFGGVEVCVYAGSHARCDGGVGIVRSARGVREGREGGGGGGRRPIMFNLAAVQGFGVVVDDGGVFGSARH